MVEKRKKKSKNNSKTYDSFLVGFHVNVYNLKMQSFSYRPWIFHPLEAPMMFPKTKSLFAVKCCFSSNESHITFKQTRIKHKQNQLNNQFKFNTK